MTYLTNQIQRLKKLIRIRSQDGNREVLVTVIRYLYTSYIRMLLPKINAEVTKQGIVVDHINYVPVLDDVLNVLNDTQDPQYEHNYISCMKPIISPGMDVVVIGGGWGVSAVIAGHKVGTEGSVTVYEASKSEVKKTEQTIKLNEQSRQTQVIHAVVGDPIKLRGSQDTRDAQVCPLEDLPKHDVLLVDCDGCEISILDNLSKLRQLPSKIVVEHHGIGGEIEYDPDSVKADIRSYDYTITKTSVEEFPQAKSRGRDPREMIIVGQLM